MSSVSINRLEAYERNDNFGSEPVLLPPVSLPDWPAAGYKQLTNDHKDDIPHVHKEHINHYFIHRQVQTSTNMNCYTTYFNTYKLYFN